VPPPQRPDWTKQILDWPEHHSPAVRCFNLLEREPDGRWRVVLWQSVNVEGDRAHRHYVKPWMWRGPNEPAHNILLQRRPEGGWEIFETLPRWWTPMWLQHHERRK
jgi:hypothetical protein